MEPGRVLAAGAPEQMSPEISAGRCIGVSLVPPPPPCANLSRCERAMQLCMHPFFFGFPPLVLLRCPPVRDIKSVIVVMHCSQFYSGTRVHAHTHTACRGGTHTCWCVSRQPKRLTYVGMQSQAAVPLGCPYDF